MAGRRGIKHDRRIRSVAQQFAYRPERRYFVYAGRGQSHYFSHGIAIELNLPSRFAGKRVEPFIAPFLISLLELLESRRGVYFNAIKIPKPGDSALELAYVLFKAVGQRVSRIGGKHEHARAAVSLRKRERCSRGHCCFANTSLASEYKQAPR